MIRKIVAVVMVPVVLGALFPVLWPLMTGSNTDIQALTDNSTSTEFLKEGWPVFLLVIGIAIVLALILYALRKLNVI